MAKRLTKAQVTFLRKVEAGGVRSYSMDRGSIWGFRGGKVTAQKYADMGLINMPGAASLEQPAYATLTDAGRVALAELELKDGATI